MEDGNGEEDVRDIEGRVVVRWCGWRLEMERETVNVEDGNAVGLRRHEMVRREGIS